MRKVVVAGLTLLVIGAIAAGGAMLVHRKRAQLAGAPRSRLAATPVRVAEARTGDLQQTLEYLAIVEPVRSATLSPRVTATVEAVHVQEGDVVEAGQVLVVLDGRDVRDAIAAARAQIEQALAELAANDATVEALERSRDYWGREGRRIEELLERGAATLSETEGVLERLDDVTGRLEAARQRSLAGAHQVTALRRRLDELQTRLSHHALLSPYDGIVSLRHVDPGAMAMPGQPLLTVEDRASLQLAFDVPQADLPHLRAGLAVTYGTRAGQAHTTITRLHPVLNAARMLRAEAILPDAAADGLTCGAYMPASVLIEHHKGVTLIPTAALIESPQGEPYVFVVEDGRLQATPVRILGRRRDLVGVQGVEPGRQVVVSTFLGWATLSSGLPVEVRP